MNNYAETVKSALSMQEVAEAYGFMPNRGGYICCPFHAEKTPSFKIYPGERGFHCFGCGESGDVIKFTRLYFGLDFRGALARLNYDFNLGLPLGEGMTARQRAQSRRKNAERERKRKEEQSLKAAQDRQYWALMDAWITSDINSREYAPKSPDEGYHPLFVEAMKRKDYQSYLIDLYT